MFSNDEIWMVMVNVLFSFHNPSNGVNSQYAKRQNTTKGVELHVQRDNDVMCHVTGMCQSDAMMMRECMLSRG